MTPSPSKAILPTNTTFPTCLARHHISLLRTARRPRSVDRTYQLGLQDKLPLLVLLRLLIRLVVFPPHRLLALPAADIPYHMSPGRHVALDGVGLRDVHDGSE